MQTGFGSPSATVGVAVMKQVTDDLTWLADANYQHFFPHTYDFTRYQFGGETRLDTSVWGRVMGRVARGVLRLSSQDGLA